MVTTLDHTFDFRALAPDPRWHFLIGDPPCGTFICGRLLDGIYEAHAAVVPEGRGPWTVQFGEAAIRYMFTATDAIEILTRVPQGHLGSLTLVRRLGFVLRWTRPSCWFRGRDVPYSVWGLTLFDWWPSEDTAREATLEEMRCADQHEKMVAWHNRYAILSREPTL